jgi:hypothetical protein
LKPLGVDVGWKSDNHLFFCPFNYHFLKIYPLKSFFILSIAKLPPVESPKGVSPLGSHGTVRESLPSYGSSCLITNVFLHYGYTNCLAVISFQIKKSSHCWLSLDLKPNRLSPSFHCLSATSQLLQLSPSLLSRVTLTRSMAFLLIDTIATSLVPYKSLC